MKERRLSIVMFSENMNVVKIPMSSRTAVDLQEDICENTEGTQHKYTHFKKGKLY